MLPELSAQILELAKDQGKITIGQIVKITGANRNTINRRAIAKDKLEHTVLNTLRDHLMDPELCGVFCKEYTSHMNRLRMEHNASISGYRAERNRLECERDRIITAVKNGFANDELRIALDRNVARREELARLLENVQETPTLIHPRMADRYRQEVTSLVAALNDDDHRTEAADLIRGLIDKIVLTPNEANDGLAIDLHGDLAGILGIAAKEKKPLDASGFNELEQVKVVAGGRIARHSGDHLQKQEKLVAGAGFTLCDLLPATKKESKITLRSIIAS